MAMYSYGPLVWWPARCRRDPTMRFTANPTSSAIISLTANRLPIIMMILLLLQPSHLNKAINRFKYIRTFCFVFYQCHERPRTPTNQIAKVKVVPRHIKFRVWLVLIRTSAEQSGRECIIDCEYSLVPMPRVTHLARLCLVDSYVWPATLWSAIDTLTVCVK
jgi:hypothetical protein